MHTDRTTRPPNDDEPSLIAYIAKAWADDWDNPDDDAYDSEQATFDSPTAP